MIAGLLGFPSSPSILADAQFSNTRLCVSMSLRTFPSIGDSSAPSSSRRTRRRRRHVPPAVDPPSSASLPVYQLIGQVQELLDLYGSVSGNVIMDGRIKAKSHNCMLEIDGVEDMQLGFGPDGDVFKSRVSLDENDADIQLSDEEEVSLVSLNEPLPSSSEWTNKDLNDFAGWLGGSYVSTELDPMNGELIVPLANDVQLTLDMSKQADREFTISLITLIYNVQRAVQMHKDLSGNVLSPAELVKGRFDGIKSRKSTQKRQKQYFEQRKWQQQQQKSNGLESYTEKKAPCTQCHENNRSLDILSLLNLSKNGQDFTSRFPEGRGSSNDQHTTTTNSQTAHCLPAIQMENENLYPSAHVEIRETSTASNHKDETVCSQEFLFDFPSSNVQKGNNEKDLMKMSTDHKLSVVDMLGDDGHNSGSSRGNLVHEKHVAFSIEGLGKVEMETPVHSPQHPTRVEQDRFKWHGKSSFVDDGFLDDSWDLDSGYMRSRKCDKPNYSFEGLHMQKRRARVEDVSGSSSPYKHQIDYDFMESDMTRCNPNPEFSEINHCSDWPSSFTTQDARPHSHLSSQDSFLSHPVWNEGTKNPSFNSTERQKIRPDFSMKNNTFSQEFSTTGDDWLFEKRCNIDNTTNASHFDSKWWTDEPFDSDFNYYVDKKPSCSMSRHDAFCQQPSLKEEYDFKEDRDESNNIHFQKSVSTRESESVTVTLPAVSSALHQHKYHSHDSNYSSSKSGTSMNVLDHEDSQVKTPDLSPCPNAILSPGPSKGGSSSVEMPQK